MSKTIIKKTEKLTVTFSDVYLAIEDIGGGEHRFTIEVGGEGLNVEGHKYLIEQLLSSISALLCTYLGEGDSLGED